MLYQVFISVGNNTDHEGSINKCVVKDYTDCPNGVEEACTSIDLLTKKSDCHVCFRNKWMSFNPCVSRTHYEKDLINIVDKGERINISIGANGTTMAQIIAQDGDFTSKSLDCKCVWSKYKYTKSDGNSSLENDGQDQFLYCEPNNPNPKFNELYYCLKNEATDNNTVCYDRKGSCKIEGQNLTCSTNIYDDTVVTDDNKKTIINQHCVEMKNCTILITSNNINISKNEWEDLDATISCNKCTKTVPGSDLCTKPNPCKIIMAKTYHNNSDTGRDNGGKVGDSKGPSYTWFLIIIIVILLLVLVSYYGYQNQWHHKVSTLLITSYYLTCLCML